MDLDSCSETPSRRQPDSCLRNRISAPALSRFGSVRTRHLPTDAETRLMMSTSKNLDRLDIDDVDLALRVVIYTLAEDCFRYNLTDRSSLAGYP
jgi:hypothetical protein